jgi:diguanylate cyclase (GGDEF)-like protein
LTSDGDSFHYAEDFRRFENTYFYVGISTAVAFILYGYLLGVAADRLSELSMTDVLTGLANRRGFLERLEVERDRARRYAQPLSLLLIDVDKLKAINDAYGHRGGDEALRRVAAAVRDRLRSSDLGARHGGDEFAIIAPHTSDEDAVHLAERIRSLVDSTPSDGSCPRLHVSFGVVTTTTPTLSTDDLLRAADKALYEAKRRGGDVVVVG